MAGIGLFNFDIDAKSVEPIAIIAVCGVAGYFLWSHLQQQKAANAAATTDPLTALANQTNNAYDNEIQMAELQQMFGGGTSSTATVANSSTLQTVQPSGTSNAGASSSAGSGSSSEVGSSPAGSV